MSKNWVVAIAIGVVCVGSVLGGGAYLARMPDFEIHFMREVPSNVPPAKLAQDVYALSNWPKWFYSTTQAQAVNLYGQPYSLKDQYVMQGSIIQLFVDPKKGKWKEFTLTARVSEYIPGKKIHFQVIKDSSGRLTKLFDRLEWDVEIVPQGAGALLRGTAIAHTKHWRSRLFGRLADRILMNNVYYPNLLQLAILDDPTNVNPLPQYQQ